MSDTTCPEGAHEKPWLLGASRHRPDTRSPLLWRARVPKVLVCRDAQFAASTRESAHSGEQPCCAQISRRKRGRTISPSRRTHAPHLQPLRHSALTASGLGGECHFFHRKMDHRHQENGRQPPSSNPAAVHFLLAPVLRYGQPQSGWHELAVSRASEARRFRRRR